MIYIETNIVMHRVTKPRAVHGFHSLNTIDRGVFQLLVAAGKAAGPSDARDGEARTREAGSGQRRRRCHLDALLPVDVARQYLYFLFIYFWL